MAETMIKTSAIISNVDPEEINGLGYICGGHEHRDLLAALRRLSSSTAAHLAAGICDPEPEDVSVLETLREKPLYPSVLRVFASQWRAYQERNCPSSFEFDGDEVLVVEEWVEGSSALITQISDAFRWSNDEMLSVILGPNVSRFFLCYYTADCRNLCLESKGEIPWIHHLLKDTTITDSSIISSVQQAVPALRDWLKFNFSSDMLYLWAESKAMKASSSLYALQNYAHSKGLAQLCIQTLVNCSDQEAYQSGIVRQWRARVFGPGETLSWTHKYPAAGVAASVAASLYLEMKTFDIVVYLDSLDKAVLAANNTLISMVNYTARAAEVEKIGHAGVIADADWHKAAGMAKVERGVVKTTYNFVGEVPSIYTGGRPALSHIEAGRMCSMPKNDRRWSLSLVFPRGKGACNRKFHAPSQMGVEILDESGDTLVFCIGPCFGKHCGQGSSISLVLEGKDEKSPLFVFRRKIVLVNPDCIMSPEEYPAARMFVRKVLGRNASSVLKGVLLKLAPASGVTVSEVEEALAYMEEQGEVRLHPDDRYSLFGAYVVDEDPLDQCSYCRSYFRRSSFSPGQSRAAMRCFNCVLIV